MIKHGQGKRIVITKKEEKKEEKKVKVATLDENVFIQELDEMKKDTDLMQRLRNHNSSLMSQKEVIGGQKTKHFITINK